MVEEGSQFVSRKHTNMGIDSISDFSFTLSQSVRDSLRQVVMKIFACLLQCFDVVSIL